MIRCEVCCEWHARSSEVRNCYASRIAALEAEVKELREEIQVKALRLVGYEKEFAKLKQERDAKQWYPLQDDSAIQQAKDAGVLEAFEFMARYLGCADEKYAVQEWMRARRTAQREGEE